MSRPALALIAAVAKNRTIGKDGGMPWHIPGDLAHFRATTRGHTVIMGRRTWESLGKALPQRRNIVVTTNAEAVFPGAETATSLAVALALCGEDKLVFCIGGAGLYKEAMAEAEHLYLTEIQSEIDGDTQFPAFDLANWLEVSRLPQSQVAEPAHYDFVQYNRRSPS